MGRQEGLPAKYSRNDTGHSAPQATMKNMRASGVADWASVMATRVQMAIPASVAPIVQDAPDVDLTAHEFADAGAAAAVATIGDLLVRR